MLETLEDRRLLSGSVAAPGPALPALGSPITITSSPTILSGTTIHAEAGQPFHAVIGAIHGLPGLQATYRLQGTIDWGDGTASSAAQFLPAPGGAIDVLGAHTYAAAGSDAISVVVTAVPPGGSLALVKLLGTIHSKALVIAPNGGVTLTETAGVAFTANLGTFRSTLSMLTMTAVITWGDGTQSTGKIVALPTTGPVPDFAVYGSHTYASTGSYPVHITVYSGPPSPVVDPIWPTPPVVLVAQIDSVIDVLPILRSTAA